MMEVATPASHRQFDSWTGRGDGAVNDPSDRPAEEWGTEYSLTASFKELLKNYSMYMKDSSQPVAVSGGMQQYLNKKSKIHSQQQQVLVQQPRRGAGSEQTTFHDLPDSLQLHIFSFLTPRDLCVACEVCRHWQLISCDDLLWKNKLEHDVNTWEVIGHTTNPFMYQECQSDWSHKEIYLRCSPEVLKSVRQQSLGFHQLTTLLRSLWPRKTPKVAMFGPGLESSTSGLVRKILYEESTTFQRIGMFPGSFEGVGTGFTIRIPNSVTLNLMTLYTTTRRERESMPRQDRLKHSRLLAQNMPNDDEENAEPQLQLRPAVRDLCRTVDAFIFVVDASADNAADLLEASGRAELYTMVNETWTTHNVPLVILACIPTHTTPRTPCIDIVKELQLSKLNRPWQIHNCAVDRQETFIPPIEWLVQQAQRN